MVTLPCSPCFALVPPNRPAPAFAPLITALGQLGCRSACLRGRGTLPEGRPKPLQHAEGPSSSSEVNPVASQASRELPQTFHLKHKEACMWLSGAQRVALRVHTCEMQPSRCFEISGVLSMGKTNTTYGSKSTLLS